MGQVFRENIPREHLVSLEKALDILKSTLTPMQSNSAQATDKDWETSKLPTQPEASSQGKSTAATLSAEEIQAIRGNERLSVVFDMGHLDKSKLARYQKYAALCERVGRPASRIRTGENWMLLTMIPSQEWPSAGKRLGMSIKEYRGATDHIMSTYEKYNEGDNVEYEKYLQSYTGQTLSDY